MAWGGETFISTQFQLQLREAALELRDARAKTRDLGLAIGVALIGVPGSSSGPKGDAGPQSIPSSSKPARRE
jgi:hypothetical protein